MAKERLSGLEMVAEIARKEVLEPLLRRPGDCGRLREVFDKTGLTEALKFRIKPALARKKYREYWVHFTILR